MSVILTLGSRYLAYVEAMASQHPLPEEIGRDLSTVRNALRILSDTKSNVGIGSSAAKGFDQAVEVLNSSQSLEEKVDGLSELLARQGVKLDDAEKGQNSANKLAALAIMATLVSALPAFLPYLGIEPKSSSDQKLVEIVAELKSIVAATTSAVDKCGQALQAPSVSPERRSR